MNDSYHTVGLGWYVVSYVMSEANLAIEDGFRNNPVLVQHLGKIEKGAFSLDFKATSERNSEGVLVYKVRGAKADGVLSFKVDKNNQGQGEGIAWAKLKLASGEEVELPLDEDAEEEAAPVPDPKKAVEVQSPPRP